MTYNLKNVHFSYQKKDPPILKNVSLSLQNGRVYGLLGKNGAGKTTLLKLLCGLLQPKSGQITLNESIPFQRKPDFLQQLIYIPDEVYVPDTSAKQFVKSRQFFYPRFEQDQMSTLMDEFEIPLRSSLKKLSFGQQKKFMIAFGLACNTENILMDEPTNGLDIPSKAQFRKIAIRHMDDSRKLIISTHQVRDLDQLIDHLLILQNSRIQLDASIADLTEKLLFTRIQAEQVDQALYSEKTFHGIQGIMPNPENIPSNLDMEMLFNAISIPQSPVISYLIQQKQLSHA
jgi:ABC-2 type transport system ATP-binding protein